MSKLFDRVVRLEDRLNDHLRIRSLEQEQTRLERKVNALIEHLGLQLKEGVTIVPKGGN